MRIASGACLLLSVALLGASVVNAQNVSDATAPEISNITFATTSVNTTAGSQAVSVSVSATDDLSGVNYFYLYLRTASNSQSYNTSSTSCAISALQSGTRTNGVFSGTCTFPQYSQSGPWFVNQVYAYDNLGNYRLYYENNAQLSTIASQTIAVTSPTAPPPSPTVVPALVSVSVNPGSVDTSTSSQTLTLTAHITSTGNYNYSYVYLYDPTNQQYTYGLFYNSTRISGDVYDGIYQTTLTLPRYSRAGNWYWNYFLLYNTDGNYAQYYNASNGRFNTLYVYNGVSSTSTNLGTAGPTLTPNNLVVTSNPSDATGPSLAFFQLNPTSIDVATQGTYVNVSATATDLLSGFNYGYVYFRSPNGQQQRGASFYASNGSTGSIYFPQYSEAGTWQLAYMYLYDFLGNATPVSSQYLFDHGFPNTIQISSGLAVANASATIGGTVTLSAVLTNLGVAVPGKTVAFAVQGNSVGSAVTDSTGKATLANVSVGSLAAGTYVNAITATFSGDGTLASSSGQATLTVTNKLNQTITFNAIADHYLSDSPITVSATASSGLAVAFDAIGNCTVSGSSVTLSAVGSCQIVASQSGNATYSPALSVSRTFNITRINQTLTFAPLANKTYGDATFGLTATASSGLTVSFALGAGSISCSVSGDTVTIAGATAGGQSCIIVASQDGDATYNAAPNVTRSFTIGKASQTITFDALPNKTYGNSPFAATATASSNLAVGFALGGGSVGCSLSGSTLTITAVTGAGQSCIVVASQSGSANYNAATPVTQSFTIAKASQTITFAALASKAYGDGPFGLTATAPGGPVTFALGAGSAGCSISGSTVTVTGATGPGQACVIVASQAGNANYSGASDVTQAFAIAKAAQTITFSALANKTYGDAPIELTASSPGGAVSFALGAGSVGCSVSGNTVSITGATGTGQSCIIVASQGGDANYAAAGDVSQAFAIAKASATLSLTGLVQTYDGSPRAAAASTTPSGLNDVSITYDGLPTAPSAAGTYAVVASLTNANYDAPPVNGTLTIAKASATLSLTGLSQTYDGSPKLVTASTTPAGLSGISMTYDGSSSAPTAAGTYAVTASLSNANYDAPSMNGTLTIARAAATLSLTGLSQTYDGSPKVVTASTTPGALSAVSITYDGSPAAPTAAGVYAVVASLTNANYDAPAVNGTLTIAKASATVSLTGLAQTYDGTQKFVTASTMPAGLSVVSITYDGSPTPPTGAGSYAVVATLSNANYQAPPTNATFVIAKAAQVITFGALPNKLFGDASFVVSASASSGLAVAFSASGACSVSAATVTLSAAGLCTITAAQSGNVNYAPAPSVSQQFDIAYTWSNVLQPINVDGTSIFKLGSTVPVKFQLTGASATVANLTARIYVAAVTNSVVGTELEAVTTSAADAGNTFRYDSVSGQYIFNLGTKTLAQGAWQLRIDLQDGSPTPHTVMISLKK